MGNFDWVNFLGSTGFVALLGIVYKFWDNRRQLKQAQPKLTAESNLVTEQAHKLGLDAQAGVIVNLQTELGRHRTAADDMEARLTKKITDLEQKLNQTLVKLDEMAEQNELLARANEASEADKALLRQEVAALRQQNAILRESSQQASDWQQRHSADPDDPPPTFHAI